MKKIGSLVLALLLTVCFALPVLAEADVQGMVEDPGPTIGGGPYAVAEDADPSLEMEDISAVAAESTADAVPESKFIDHPNWIEASTEEMNAKFWAGDKFIMVRYRTTSTNCQNAKGLFEQWLVNYGAVIYGINVDYYSIESWMTNFYREPDMNGYYSLPLVCFAQGGSAISFTGDDYVSEVQAYFDEFMAGGGQNGLIQGADGYYYYYVNGAPQGGWINISGNWHFFDRTSYRMQGGWLYDYGNWYFLDRTNGIMATGWLWDNAWYYMDPSSGIMHTGWLNTYGDWRFMDKSSGAQKSGWLWDGGNWYYLNPSNDGIMVTGIVTIGGVQHSFSSGGVWLGQIYG